MNKYSRHSSIISRQDQSSAGNENHWYQTFEKVLVRESVQPRSPETLFEQINNIMNRKSKHTSVAAVVEDMKERSGLTAYLNQINKQSDNGETNATINKKVAQQSSDNNQVIDKKIEMTPIAIQKHPAIAHTLENCIRDTKGNLSVPAIIGRVRSIHQNDVSNAKDWDDDKLTLLVSKLNLDAKKNNPGNYEQYQNLGSRDSGSDTDIDPSNTDAFHALNPARG
jgi:hypothetical protein